MSEKEIKTINKQPIADIVVRKRVSNLEEDFSQHSKDYDKLLNTVSQQSEEIEDLEEMTSGVVGYPCNFNYWTDKTPLTKEGAIYEGVIAFSGGSQAIYALPVVEGETYAFLMWNENWTDATVVQAQNILQGAFISDTDLPTESNNACSIVGSRTGALVSAQITAPTNAKWFIFALQPTADVSTLFWEKITEENPSISVPTNEMEVLKNGHEQRLSILENLISKYNGKVWVAMGDSLTAENTLGVGIDNYTNYVSDKLGIEMLNFGHAGTGYWRTHEEGNAFYQRAENIPNDFDVITIFGSFNDLGDDTNGVHGYKIIGTYTDTTEDTICGCMNILLDRIYEKNPKALVGIIAPTPWATPTDGMYHANKEVEDMYINGIKSVAERRSIPFLDLLHCSNMHPWDSDFRNTYYLNADGVHPNTNGHKRFSNQIAKFIESILYTE